MTKREFTIANEYRYNRSGPARWILSHLLRTPWIPLLTLGVTILNNYAYSSIQVLVGRAFDVINTTGWAVSDLQAVLGGLIVLALTQGLSGLGRNYSVEFLAQLMERDAREEFYVSLLGKSQTFHGRQRIGEIMARATDDVRTLNYMFSPGVMLITDAALSLIMPLILMAQMEPRLLLVPGLFTVALVFTVSDYNRRLKPVSLAQREAFGRMDAGLAETIAGIEVVKASTQEQREWEQFATNAARYRDYYVEQGKIEAKYWPMLAFSIAWALAFLHGLWLWHSGILTLGQVIGFMGLFGSLRFTTFISIFSFNLVQLGMASAGRILELINVETELDENTAGVARPMDGAVTFEGVSFSYNGKPVLRNISFTARPGETIAIVGQTGSGKSTIAKLINRIYDVDEGRVLVDGVDVRDWNLESLRQQVSIIEQDIFLFSRTIAENIAFGQLHGPEQTPVSPAQIEAAARAAQAHEFITGFAAGYNTVVGERGTTLSGGQRQRVALARAFLTDPAILILDDATSAIDSATEDRIQRAIERAAAGRTTFLITHRLSQIRWADLIIVMKKGRIDAIGSHEELMTASEAYRNIFARYE